MGRDAAEIRASYAKTIVGEMKRSRADQRERLLRRLGDDRRRVIRNYGMLAYMPASEFASLVDLVLETLGVDDAVDFFRASMRASLDRRLLTPLRLGAIALYGDTPRSLLKMAPQAWQIVTRNCGTCATEVRPPDGVMLRFEGLPPALQSPGVIAMWRGGMEACVNRMEFDGMCSANDVTIWGAVAELAIDWTRAKGRSAAS